MQVTIEVKRKTFDNIVQKLLDEKRLQIGNPVFVNTKVRLAIEEAIENEFGDHGKHAEFDKNGNGRYV